MIKKTLQPTNDLYMQFTEDELNELGIKPGDKFDVKPQEDGSIKLEKYVKMEIDMTDWDRDTLEMLITFSCEEDITISEAICKLLKQAIELEETDPKEVFQTPLEEFMKGRELLNETYFTTNAVGKEHTFPTPHNTPYTYDTTEDVLPEFKTYKETNISKSIAFTDPKFTNNDTSIISNKPGNYKGEF